jgi:uncharacterized coiled-coil protein SlyX
MHTISSDAAAAIGLPMFSDSRPRTTAAPGFIGTANTHFVRVMRRDGPPLYSQAAPRATARDWLAMAGSSPAVMAAELYGPHGLCGTITGADYEGDALCTPEHAPAAMRARVAELETESSWKDTRIAALERQLAETESERDFKHDHATLLKAERNAKDSVLLAINRAATAALNSGEWFERALIEIAEQADHGIEGTTPGAGEPIEAPRMERLASTGGL